MTGEQNLKTEDLKREYLDRLPNFQKMAGSVSEALHTLLAEAQVPYLNIDNRVKEFDSFEEKIKRKNYSRPFEDAEDLCGIRVIVYFPSDVTAVGNILSREFDVISSEVKADDLQSDQFGYRSDHFILRLRQEWLATPNFRGLGGAKAEVQVRTVLMHAWANLSHKLAYKDKDTTPAQFLRNIYRLSALFELADEQFEGLRRQKEDHISGLITAAVNKDAPDTLLESPLNVDTLQAYLEYRFSDRESPDTRQYLHDLIKEMDECGTTLKDLDRYYLQCKDNLAKIERILTEDCEFDHFSQVGIARQILENLDETHWSNSLYELSPLESDDEPDTFLAKFIADRQRVLDLINSKI